MFEESFSRTLVWGEGTGEVPSELVIAELMNRHEPNSRLFRLRAGMSFRSGMALRWRMSRRSNGEVWEIVGIGDPRCWAIVEVEPVSEGALDRELANLTAVVA